MAKVAVYNMEGKEVGSMDLNDAVFGVEVNEHLVHMAVLQQLANNRQGTQKAKTRSEVRGGGRKPWRQKGTGHARQGSISIPYGQTTTYGAIAKQLAAKKGKSHMSAQAVGGAVGHNEISIIVPCHRVVGSNGSLTGYAGGIDKKIKLLELEKAVPVLCNLSALSCEPPLTT